MSETIPDDVMKAATEAVIKYEPVRRGQKVGGGAWTGHEIREAIARAIMAERERCAKIAEGASAMDALISRLVAAAIRGTNA